VAVLTQTGKLLLFPLAELKEMAKGKGLMLIDLTKERRGGRRVAVTGQALLIGGSGRGGKPASSLSTPVPRRRSAAPGPDAGRKSPSN
jgi:topoisomerase-4 subunit A